MYRFTALLFLLLLAACAPGRATLAPTIDLAQPTPTDVLYAPQETTYPGPCAYPAAEALCPVEAPPLDAYPAPTGDTALLEQPPAGEQAPANAFQDCARTPGIVGCAEQAQPLRARLAFYEAASSRLIFLDLESGAGAQASLDAPPRALDWSADGSRLLVDLGSDTYALYDAAGGVMETFQSEAAPRWQPDGSLSRDGSVRSAEGWQASLYTEDALSWELHVRNPAGEQAVLPLSGASPDALFSLRGWVPGQPVVVLQTYTAGNAAMLAGAQVALLDVTSGVYTALDAFAPLDEAAFAWNPPDNTAARLAFLSGGAPEGAQGIALYDPIGGALSFPLPEGALIGGLAWRDGGHLAFSVNGLAPDASEAGRDTFPAPGIYLLDVATGAVEPLVQSPPAAQDGWPQWTPDADLLFARALPGNSGAGAAQVLALQPQTGQEAVLVTGLPLGETVAGQVVWRQLLAFTQK